MSLKLTSGRANLLAQTAITTAVTNVVTTAKENLAWVRALALKAIFVYGSGGTNLTAYIQTSLDGGTNWIDIACFQFTTASAVRVFTLDSVAVTTIYTPTDAALTVNTCKSGILGDMFRVKYTSTGTYAGSTTIQVSAVLKP